MTALVTAIQPLWPLLKDRGIDPEPVFLESGIAPDRAKAANARVPVTECRAIWERADALIDDPTWGIRYGEYWHPSMFGPLGYAWLTSPTLRAAYERLSRFIDLFIERGVVTLRDADDSVLINFNYRNEPFALPSVADAMTSLGITMCRAIYGSRLRPTELSFVHAAPEHPGSYEDYFGCPVTFSADCDCVRLSAVVVDTALPGANPHLAEIAKNETIRYLAKLNAASPEDRIRRFIIDQLPNGRITGESVADAMHMSRRTLYRQLDKAGLTFNDLLQEVRMELAQAYLSVDTYSVSQIAFMLGFSEQAAFSRAYRRWYDESPSQTRERLAGDSASQRVPLTG